MGIGIFVETTFEVEDTKRRNIGRFRRPPGAFGFKKLGLGLNGAKGIVKFRGNSPSGGYPYDQTQAIQRLPGPSFSS